MHPQWGILMFPLLKIRLDVKGVAKFTDSLSLESPDIHK